ncbi:hypothetical protein IIA79_07220, partial [bacterium]|nr:hypothetical protein [bacterium]
KSILALKHAFRLMFRLGMSRDNALAEIDAAVPKTTEVRHFIDWMKAPSERGVCKAEIASRFSVVGGADTSVGGAGVPARQPHTLESKGRDAGTGTGGTAQPKV